MVSPTGNGVTPQGKFGEFGAFELFVIRPGSRPPYGFATALARWGRAVADGDKPLCLCCDHEFLPGNDPPDAWTLAVPVCASPSMMILTALCERCARSSDDEIMTSAYECYRKMGLRGRWHRQGQPDYAMSFRPAGDVAPAAV